MRNTKEQKWLKKTMYGGRKWSFYKDTFFKTKWNHLKFTPPSSSHFSPPEAAWLNEHWAMWVISLQECSDRLGLPGCVIFLLSVLLLQEKAFSYVVQGDMSLTLSSKTKGREAAMMCRILNWKESVCLLCLFMINS